MSNSNTIKALQRLLADTYALYLKTQNFHWNVKGNNFKTYHLLFEEQYQALALGVDDIAERILTIGGVAPASFKIYAELTSIQDGDPKTPSHDMVKILHDDHTKVIAQLYEVIKDAEKDSDEGTVSFIGARIESHEKIRWMLQASL